MSRRPPDPSDSGDEPRRRGWTKRLAGGGRNMGCGGWRRRRDLGGHRRPEDGRCQRRNNMEDRDGGVDGGSLAASGADEEGWRTHPMEMKKSDARRPKVVEQIGARS